MFEIKPEGGGCAPHIETLLDEAFGPGRFARAAYRLREGVLPCAGLSFCAWAGKTLAGSVRFWPIRVGGHVALLLGPLAVSPRFQGQGAGRLLVAHGCEAADQQGHKTIILVGEPAYYAPFGFVPIPAGQVIMPGAVDLARLLWRGGGANIAGRVVKS